MATNDNYNFIKEKIDSLRLAYPSLKGKSDDYLFTALAIRSNLYKNPSLQLRESDIEAMIVDGCCDGGVDALLTDPNSESSDLVLVQSKFYTSISFEDVSNAITKLVTFYKNMVNGSYEKINEKVINRFLTLNSEVGDESKIVFVFYTSSPRNGIQNKRIEKAFNVLKGNDDRLELKVYFADDICDEIKEAESRRPSVEQGKLFIDETDNYLYYGDDAIICNVSALCIKELYGTHGLNLLARNLRYHVAGANIDRAIKDSIASSPELFWYKNNGLTIICDDFEVSGRQVKLKNFSIVNGGQTTYNLFKSKDLNKDNDFYLPCKIIIAKGDTEDEKNTFSLEIAKATNSQKAIKPIDLKANSPEQVRFGTTMRGIGIYYQTKRGEVIPKEFKEDYKNTDLADTGKLCLSAIFQLPATSRNKPSCLYNSEYYELVFNSNQSKIGKIVEQLLYIDYYFRNDFLKKFDVDMQDNPNSTELIPFGHNARTACIAFVAFASRYYQGNLTKDNIKTLFNAKEGSYNSCLYDIFKNIDGFDYIFDPKLFRNKDDVDKYLYKLFVGIIKAGRKCYSLDKKYDSGLNESNYLKKDFNYYNILKNEWDTLEELIKSEFDEIKEYTKSI